MPTAKRGRQPKRKPRARAKRGAARWLSALGSAKLLVPAIAAAALLAAYTFDPGRDTERLASIRPLSELHYRTESVATASIGEEFTLDGLRYRVSGAIDRGTIHGFQRTLGRFIEVAIVVANDGTAGARPDDVTLMDKNSTQYPQGERFSMEGNTYWEGVQQDVLPGTTKRFLALFDVASGSSGFWLALHGPDGMASRIVWLGM